MCMNSRINSYSKVKLDIQNFQPEEIAVKAVKGFLMVDGKHEERGERLGLISHQFTRRYVLPEGVFPEDITCSLGSDGILTLSAPRKVSAPAKEVNILIDKTPTSGATVFDVTSPLKEKPTPRLP